MKKQDFDKLVLSVKQAGRIRRGEARASRTFKFTPADIKKIRERLHQSQSEFAMMIGVSVSTLQNWEQGRRVPEGPARALLKVAAENPKAYAQIIHYLMTVILVMVNGFGAYVYYTKRKKPKNPTLKDWCQK